MRGISDYINKINRNLNEKSGYLYVAPNHKISDEVIELAVKALNHLDKCVEYAYDLGFTISFQLKNSTLNRIFTVKYCACSFLYGGAFAIEEWVQ